MGSITTTAGAGAALLLAGVLCIKFGHLPRGRNWLMLLAGACLTGAAGLLGTALGWVARAVDTTSNVVGGMLIGGTLAALVAIAYVWALIAHMHPKKGSPTKATPWLALLAFPALGLIVGGIFATMPGTIQQAVTQAMASIVDGFRQMS